MLNTQMQKYENVATKTKLAAAELMKKYKKIIRF